MKVTKSIREFIEEQVRIKAEQSTSILELERKADEASKKFEDEMKTLKDKMETEFRNVLKKYNHKYADGMHLGSHMCSSRDLPEVIAYHKAIEELREKMRRATLDIIVEMEMGGTKAELMDKLDKLKF